MRRALFLYNPISGRRHDARLRDITAAAEVFRRAGVATEIEEMASPGSTPLQARAAADADVDAVIVCGGDGSVHEALQGLVNRRTALGVLPLGTGNALANDLRLPRHPARAAQMLLDAKPHPLRLPRMDFANPAGQISDPSRYFIVGAGMGADAQLTYRMTLASKHRWGMAAYYTEAWRQWFTYDYPLFEVEFREGDRLRRERVSQVLAIRVEWMGGFLRRLAPGASLYRDDLRLVLMKSRRRWSYIRYVTGVQFNRAWTGADIELVYATELTCRPISGSPRIYAEADGELLSTLPVSITMTDATVNLLIPNQKLSS
jgi:diacylglycerol kinase family enzyme